MPRLRICGEPTVREASASAGSSSASSGAHRLGVGQAGAEPKRAVLARPAAQLRRPRSGSGSPAGPRAVEVERDHHVRPALDRQRVGMLGPQPERLVEAAWREDVHGANCTVPVQWPQRFRDGSQSRAATSRPTSSCAAARCFSVFTREWLDVGRRDRRRLRRGPRRLRGRARRSTRAAVSSCRGSSTRTCTSSRRSCSSTSSRGSCCRSARPRSSPTRTRSRTCSAPTASTGCSTSAAGLPLDVCFMASSCVPASQFESPRRELTTGDLDALLRRRRVLGLAEMMNFPGVISGDRARAGEARARAATSTGTRRACCGRDAERVRRRRHPLRPRGVHAGGGARAAAARACGC